MTADFIEITEGQTIAMLHDEDPALRAWALSRLELGRGVEQLDPAWIDAAISDPDPRIAYIAITSLHNEPRLIARHMPRISEVAAGELLLKLRARSGDLAAFDALQELSRGEAIQLASELLALDAEAYLDARLAPERPPLDGDELASWLIHAPHVRADLLAAQLIAQDIESLYGTSHGLGDALGLRAVGALDPEGALEAHIEEARARLLAALPAGQLDAPRYDLDAPPLAIQLAKLAPEPTPYGDALLKLTALCMEREARLRAFDPRAVDVAALVSAWLYTGPHHDATLRAWTLERWSEDPASRAPLLDAIRAEAPALYNTNRHAPLYRALLDAPGFDPAELLSWDLVSRDEYRYDELTELERLILPLAQRDPARWLDLLRQTTRVSIASGMTVAMLLASLPGEWPAAERLAWFDARYADADPLDDDDEDDYEGFFAPEGYELCREELMIGLLHIPTLRHHATQLTRNGGSDRLVFADITGCIICAHKRGIIDALPDAIPKLLRQQRVFSKQMLSGASDDLRLQLNGRALLLAEELDEVEEDLKDHPNWPALVLERQRLQHELELDEAREGLARALTLLPDPSIAEDRPLYALSLAESLRRHAEPDHMLRLWLPAPQSAHDAIMLSDIQRWERLASLLAMPGVKNIKLERTATPPPRQILHKFLTEGDAPAQPVRVGPKVGRNDPCPCGSGKKYKKCHGGADD
jgi:hypothetical protein